LIFVSDDDVRRHVTFADVLAAVERAFVALDEGTSAVFDVVRGRGGGDAHFFAVKAGRDGSIPALGLKVGSYAPGNHERGMAAHTSTTILVDDLTGRPFALVEANYLNGLRTAAADALAVRMLSRQDSSTLGIIGIGDQAICEALAVAHVRPIRRILAAGSSEKRRTTFREAVTGQLAVPVEFVDAETAARAADILVTVTPSRAPIVHAEWIRPGTHVSAMGADDHGKQELEVELVARSQLWVDHPGQAIRIGETQHAFRAGLVSEEQVRSRTLGRLLRMKQPARDDRAITVFDSSGLAIQDLAAAHAALTLVAAHRP
jgi:ornithine cyclodeaminase